MSLRILQRKLAEEVTAFVHSAEDLEKAIQASNILFEAEFSAEVDRQIAAKQEGKSKTLVEKLGLDKK